jgi:hypothetical protein
LLATGSTGGASTRSKLANECVDVPAPALVTPRGQPAIPLPEKLVAHYSELLRAYVVMGSGNLTAEMNTLADLLVNAGVTPHQTMLLHLEVLEQLIHGLGSRSARHVMSRADLLVLEVMVHLAEGYRSRYLERQNPPQQLPLPGFGG